MISVIVIAYNEEHYLPVLLDCLLAQTWRDFEVIVVDSGSSDRTREVARAYEGRFQAFSLLDLGCINGPGYARNRGAERARHERLLFLDSDTVVDRGFLERAVAALKRFRADVASCLIRVPGADLKARIGAFLLNTLMVLLQPVYVTAYGACLFSTRAVHHAVGGFREHLGICEDCEYVKRARQSLRCRYRILPMTFGTSDRRARSEGAMRLMMKYLRVHAYRMLSRREIPKGTVVYEYGDHHEARPGA